MRALPVFGSLALAAAIVVLFRGGLRSDVPFEVDRAKGGLSIAVIRDRGGSQQKFSSRCAVRPSDRLRVEYGTLEPTKLASGVVTSTGEWIELEPLHDVDRGTHLSTSSLRVDPTGLAGNVVVGDEQQISRARRGDVDGTAHVTIEQEPPAP